jgi:VRR-NUC domain
MIPLPDDYELQDPSTVPIKKEEAREQARLVAALRRRWNLLPDEMRPVVAHIPNGGSRDAREASNLKIQGVLAGIPDLIIVLPCGESAWIEMKAKDGRVSKGQADLHTHFHALGHDVITAYSAEEALAALRKRFH